MRGIKFDVGRCAFVGQAAPEASPFARCSFALLLADLAADSSSCSSSFSLSQLSQR